MTPTITPTPNNHYSIDKSDTGPELERRIIVPTAFVQSARYQIENGLLYTFSMPNTVQSAQVRLPRGEYSSLTIELWALHRINGRVDIDIGANGSTDWSPTITRIGNVVSIDLSNALNTYMTNQVGDMVNVPISVRSPAAGELLIARVKSTPKVTSDLSVSAMQISRSVVSNTRGLEVHQISRSSKPRISTTIRNTGSSQSVFTTVSLAIDIPGQGLWYIDSKVLQGLSAGASQVVNFDWNLANWPTMRGQLKVIVDPYNTLGDRVLGNNSRAINVDIVNGALKPTITPTRTRTVTRTPTKGKPRPTLTRTPTRRR